MRLGTEIGGFGVMKHDRNGCVWGLKSGLQWVCLGTEMGVELGSEMGVF